MNKLFNIFASSIFSLSIIAQTNISQPLNFHIEKEVLSPLLRVVPQSQIFVDEDTNGAIDAQENCTIRFEITNEGRGDGVGCVVRTAIAGTTTGIIVRDIALPTILSGEKRWVEVPIQAGKNTETGEIQFSIVVDEPNGYGTDPIVGKISTHKLKTPFVQVASYKVVGGDDGKLNRLEMFKLQVIVQNTDQGTAENVTVGLHLPENVNWQGGSEQYLNIGSMKPKETKMLEYELMASQRATDMITIMVNVAERTGRFSKDTEIPLHFGQYTKGNIALVIETTDFQNVSTTETKSVIIPTCTIHYPIAYKSTYSSSSILLCYSVSGELGEDYKIEFSVGGKTVEPIKQMPHKGAQTVSCTEVELPMPQDTKRETPVSVLVVGANEVIWSRDKREFKYVCEIKPTLHVFAVGVNKYKSDDFQNLKYAVYDAKDFAETIMNYADKNEYKQVDTTIILDEAANRYNLEDQLIELSKRVQKDDVVMLFFSGHGANVNDDSYFITSEAKDPLRGLSFHFINQRVKDMKAQGCHIFVFMDACHSGAMRSNIKGNELRPITLAEPGVVGYYSCTERQKSIEKDELKNGVFTYALIEGIKHGKITISSLEAYIIKLVQEETNNDQYPLVIKDESIDNDYVIFYKRK